MTAVVDEYALLARASLQRIDDAQAAARSYALLGNRINDSAEEGAVADWRRASALNLGHSAEPMGPFRSVFARRRRWGRASTPGVARHLRVRQCAGALLVVMSLSSCTVGTLISTMHDVSGLPTRAAAFVLANRALLEGVITYALALDDEEDESAM